MAQYELNLQDYLRIIRKRKFIIISSIVIFAIASSIYIANQVPVYSTQATVKIEEKKSISPLGADWPDYSIANPMETQTKVIKGFGVLRRAAKKLGYVTEKSTQSEINEMAAMIEGEIETQQVGNTNLIEITATASRQQEAMNLANMVAESYIEENLLEKNSQARATRTFIESQLNVMRKRLAAAENKLKKFGERNLTNRSNDESARKLADMQLQLNTLLQKYTELHPKVIQLREQTTSLKKQLSSSSGEEIEAAKIQREVEVNRKIYGMLRERLEEVRISEAEKVPDVTLITPATLPEAPNNGQSRLSLPLGMFLGLVMGLILSIVIENLDTSFGTIEDVENVMKLPVLGVIPSIYTELPPDKNILTRLRRRFFAHTMNDPVAEHYTRLLVFHKPSSPITESFRNIRTTLMFKSIPKTIMVTSSNPKEGKTSLVTNLSLTMSQEGQRTLLVAADLRRPAIAKTFGIESTPGLSEILTGTATLDESVKGLSDMIFGNMQIDQLVRSPAMKNIWVLPSGKIPTYPAELLNSTEMSLLIEEMKSKFDVILFDAPPVLVVTDASILAPKMDKIVLVYEIGKTSRHALARAKAQIEAVDGKIAGVVLNHISQQTEVFKSYPYYYHYKYTKDEGT
jgi:Mrp family chromosome partitioning ATPase/uncharacterized protein involved in exopolysaccharide biosynthesis